MDPDRKLLTRKAKSAQKNQQRLKKKKVNRLQKHLNQKKKK